ncbi:unnamed protein product, partial [marine sediment metagenome]
NDDPTSIYVGLQTGPNSGINFVKSPDRWEGTELLDIT